MTSYIKKKCDWTNPHIHFGIEYHLVELEVETDYRSAKTLLNLKDLRPANASELDKWPDWDKKMTVLAIGSTFTDEHGEEHVPCLHQVNICTLEGKKQKCALVTRCGMVNINKPFYKGAYLLAVREV